MKKLKGLFIEDEINNVYVYEMLLAKENLTLDYFEELPLNIEDYYPTILEKQIDFLIIDYHLDKQVQYKGIDVLKEIRKHDNTIYAVLLTNYQLEEFREQFSVYDYELNKEAFKDRYKDVAEKIKRACELRKDNFIIQEIEKQSKKQSDSDTITLQILEDISRKLDSKD